MSAGKRPTGPNAAKRRHLKRQLAARDGAVCFYCGHRFAALTGATIDHLIPYSVWPTWRQVNLVLACHPCNQAKADRLPQDILRPSGLAPGLVPVRSGRSVRRAVGWTVRRAVGLHAAARSAGRSAGRVDISGGGRPVRPAWTVRHMAAHPPRVLSRLLSDAGRGWTVRRGAARPPEVIECGRCAARCRRDRLDEEPVRWLLARPPVRAAYCWRCAAAIADELLLGVAS